MTPDELLDLLGGRDLLVMMCDANEFIVVKDGVKFWVGPCIVKLSYIPVTESKVTVIKYRIYVKNCKTKSVNFAERFYGENIRPIFEVLTGYSLSF